jgi:septum formation protein
MLEPILHILSSKRIVLASSSPRRKEIFSQSCPNLKIEIVPSSAEENLDESRYIDKPWAFAQDTAMLKAREVFERLLAENDPRYNDLVTLNIEFL